MLALGSSSPTMATIGQSSVRPAGSGSYSRPFVVTADRGQDHRSHFFVAHTRLVPLSVFNSATRPSSERRCTASSRCTRVRAGRRRTGLSGATPSASACTRPSKGERRAHAVTDTAPPAGRSSGANSRQTPNSGQARRYRRCTSRSVGPAAQIRNASTVHRRRHRPARPGKLERRRAAGVRKADQPRGGFRGGMEPPDPLLVSGIAVMVQ